LCIHAGEFIFVMSVFEPKIQNDLKMILENCFGRKKEKNKKRKGRSPPLGLAVRPGPARLGPGRSPPTRVTPSSSLSVTDDRDPHGSDPSISFLAPSSSRSLAEGNPPDPALDGI